MTRRLPEESGHMPSGRKLNDYVAGYSVDKYKLKVGLILKILILLLPICIMPFYSIIYCRFVQGK
jgi:hypothetical protein